MCNVGSPSYIPYGLIVSIWPSRLMASLKCIMDGRVTGVGAR